LQKLILMTLMKILSFVLPKKKEAKGTSVMGHINKGAATRTTDKSQKRSPN